jgi:hypothetical protein
MVEEVNKGFIMDTDWLIQEPIDFEHKKYVLLAYFKKIDQLLDQNKIYPTFIELSLHLASIQTLMKDNVILYTDKVFKSFDDEVLVKDLKAKQVVINNEIEKIEIDKIVKFSSSKFLEYFSIVKSYWSIVYDTISISLKKNKKYLKHGTGYLTYTHKKTNTIYVWEYAMTQFIPEINEYYTEVKLIYEGNKKDLNLNEILDTTSTYPENIRKVCPVFEVKTADDYPIDETLLPLFKRKLMSYIMQSVRLEQLKKI